MKSKILLILALLLIITATIHAEVPQLLNYQGKLSQTNGSPVTDGTYSIQFAIYDVPTGGTALWSEINSSVQVKSGLFSALLGNINNFPANIFSGASRFLAIKVGTNAEMLPRQQITSVGYAFKAEKADVANTVVDGAIATDKIADKAVTVDKLANGAVTSEKLSNNITLLGNLNISSLTGDWDKSKDGYIRIGDVQICWGIGGSGTNPQAISLPAPFLDTVYSFTIMNHDWISLVYSHDFNARTQQSVTVIKKNLDGSDYTGSYGSFDYIAIGRWR